jgi:hypothetical protein
VTTKESTPFSFEEWRGTIKNLFVEKYFSGSFYFIINVSKIVSISSRIL